MRNNPNRSVDHSGSPTSIRDTFADEIFMVRPIDDSPFDEPPHSGVRSSSHTKYSLDGYSFYQSSAQIEDGYMIESRPIHISQKLSKKRDPGKSFLQYHYSDEDDDASSDAYGSFLSAYPISENDSVNEFDVGECHHCDMMLVNFQTFCGLPVSSYRSKPLRKPAVWKGYTCFRGKCPDVYPSTTDEYDCCKEDIHGNASLRKFEHWHRNEGRTKFSSNDVLSMDSATEITGDEASEDDSHENEFFQAKSLQGYLDYAKISAQDFLKDRIFVDDPDTFFSNHEAEDESDSITNGST